MLAFYMSLITAEEDKAAFEKIYLSQRNKLYNIAMRMLNNSHLSEEAVSEAFFNISRYFNKINNLTSPQMEAYCVLTIKNVCKNKLRDETKVKYDSIENMDTENFSFSDTDLDSIDKIDLKDKISLLNKTDKEILLMYYFYDMTLKEISLTKYISLEAAKKRLQHARKNLKILLGDDFNKK